MICNEPFPLTISLRTKQAMLRDWGSLNADFNRITACLREGLPAIGTLVPRETGHVLVPRNGAYCERIAKICTVLGRMLTTLDYAEDAQVRPEDVDAALARDPSITHVALMHCETSTGIQNPLHEIALVVAKHGKGLIVDAMSSFGALYIDARTTPLDAVVAASSKCLEGPPGMGFVIARRAALEMSSGNSHSLAMDPHGQWTYMNKTTQWRFTPPTHAVAAFDAALAQYLEEGGLEARGARCARNCRELVEGMAGLGLESFLPAAIQAPIIVTFHAPADPRYAFKNFYEAVKRRGYILYPGKLTTVETFRVGCMAQLGPQGIAGAVEAVREVLQEMFETAPAAH